MMIDNHIENDRLFSGQTALPFMLVIGGIIIEVIIAGALIAFFVNNMILGERLAIRSLSAANVGVQDAAMKISNNKELASAGSHDYSMDVGEDVVDIEISRSSSGGSYVFTVTSTASANNQQSRLVAVFIVNQRTGRISLSSITEQPI